MDNKLLNCPFCGGSDLFRAADNINSTDRVICKLCKGSAVLWKWNDRVTAQHPAVEALKSAEEWADIFIKLGISNDRKVRLIGIVGLIQQNALTSQPPKGTTDE